MKNRGRCRRHEARGKETDLAWRPAAGEVRRAGRPGPLQSALPARGRPVAAPAAMRGVGRLFQEQFRPRSSQMRNFRSHPTQRRDHYQELTDRIVAALEAGVTPWRRPWDPNACGGSNMPVNVATGHRYRGVNLFVLSMSSLASTSSDPRWCSYRQAAARGWQVRKGEKATPVYFYKPIEIEDKTADRDRETRCIP